ncbi:MAG: hypothetical protein ACK5KP_12670 [Paludibacteraceae bacterium]
MKKKIFAVIVTGLLATSSIFAYYTYRIECRDGSVHEGYMSAETEELADEVLEDLRAYYCD